MNKILVVGLCCVSLLSSNIANAGLKNFLFGSVVGGVVGYAIAPKESHAQPAPQPSTPKVESKHTILMCDSFDGLQCNVFNSGVTLTPAQFTRKAGFKYIYRYETAPHSGMFLITMEVSN